MWSGLISLALLLSPIRAEGFSPPHGNGSELYKPYAATRQHSPSYHDPSELTNNALKQVKRQSTSSTGTCAPGRPCENGACCGSNGLCGFSPNECGDDVCVSNCDAKAQCGQYGLPGNNSCPLNVCCSQFGFCGTTTDFCERGCQEGYGQCGPPTRPSCSNVTAIRNTGYYASWAAGRPCMSKDPADLDVSSFTDMVFAFAFFDPKTFQITPMSSTDPPLYPRFTNLKSKKASLKTWIAIGGWSFNDATNEPDTQRAFSDMTSSAGKRGTFIQSCIQFMQEHSFDGIDIDWEYPGADDRGGVYADTGNFVSLLQEMRAAFGNRYGISLTLPLSYWYLRWFDVNAMQQYVDFYNLMSYDIHGIWDATNKETGPYVRPHTNLTEIREGLDLLWRNSVDPQKINLGLAWYGRSFTLTNSSCTAPGCEFTAGGNQGQCSGEAGILMNSEISETLQQKNVTPSIDRDAAVKWITWDSDQWVSYDDGETMSLKIQAANDLCLGGRMVWSMDQDGANNSTMLSSAGFDPQLAAVLQSQLNSTTTSNNTCIGQELTPASEGAMLGCDAMSMAYNVSTGDLRDATGSEECVFNSTICLPMPCPLDTVEGTPSCAELAARYSTPGHNVSIDEFRGWNMWIVGDCEALTSGQKVCMGCPGEMDAEKASWNGTSSNYTFGAPTGTGLYPTAISSYPPVSSDTMQTSSVSDSNATISTTEASSEITTSSTETTETASSTNDVSTTSDLSLTTETPSEPTQGGNATTTTPTGPDPYYTTASPAQPTQSGTIPDCGRYYDVQSGDTCSEIALRFGITFSDLQDYNTYLDDQCTNLWVDSSVCVARVSTGAPTTDGTCGPDHGWTTCEGTQFGDCCSKYGYCGSGEDYCSADNCMSGACQEASGPRVSKNGTCGPDYGDTVCEGSGFGECCSVYGYCGWGWDYCDMYQCYSGNCYNYDMVT